MEDYTIITPQQITEAITRYLHRTGFTRFSPKAALIDMDGTLYDSMKYHTLAWHRMMTETGIECSRDEFYLYEGMTGAETIDLLIRRARGRHATEEEKSELYKVKTGYFNKMPKVEKIAGAADMLRILSDSGITRVLVTGSSQASLLTRLENDFPGAFSQGLQITSHDVVHGKPHPEPYLRGMALAKTNPWQTIVVENAPLGVKSGHDAGAFTVAVTTGPIPPVEMVRAGADLVCPSMEEFARILPALLGNNQSHNQ